MDTAMAVGTRVTHPSIDGIGIVVRIFRRDDSATVKFSDGILEHEPLQLLEIIDADEEDDIEIFEEDDEEF
jgi:hypothetical protein